MNYRTINRRKAFAFRSKYLADKYGFQPEETYNLDKAIVSFCLPRLKYFRDHIHSYPGDLTYVGWRGTLGEIIEGFEIYNDKDWYEMTDEDRVKVNRALDLFRERFHDLWD